MITGRVFNIQRFSLHDGPGIRTTVFLKGCALHCAWCHNPESQSPHPQLVRVMSRCIRCGRCGEDELAVPVVRGRDADDVDQCPSGALQTVGQDTDAATLVSTLVRDRVFFEESGGGVTFSGGEPLLQAAFVTETMRLLHADGVATALDTSGYARWPDLRAAAAHADLILYDLKLIDNDRHLAATGVPNDTILRNLVSLSEAHSDIRIRIPVIPGFNDDDENLLASAAFVSSLPGIHQVDLLPYHSTGAMKFARVGMDDALHGTPPPTDERLGSVAAYFRARNLKTTIGGGS